jgi:hypothetical protein
MTTTAKTAKVQKSNNNTTTTKGEKTMKASEKTVKTETAGKGKTTTVLKAAKKTDIPVVKVKEVVKTETIEQKKAKQAKLDKEIKAAKDAEKAKKDTERKTRLEAKKAAKPEKVPAQNDRTKVFLDSFNKKNKFTCSKKELVKNQLEIYGGTLTWANYQVDNLSKMLIFMGLMVRVEKGIYTLKSFTINN